MDNLTPPLLTAIREIRWHLLAGRSLKESLLNYLHNHHDELSVKLNELWSLKMQGQLDDGAEFPSHYARALWDLIERGHQGQPILEPLMHLEEDVDSAARSDLDMHLATLPFKALLPLLLFQFPAFVILLIGPLLRELARNTFVWALVALCGFSVTDSFAESLNEAAVKRMDAAENGDSVTKIQAAFDKIRIARMACQVQLQEKIIPYACYQALHLEKDWGLHKNKTQLRSLSSRIDQRCGTAAEKLRGLNAVDLRLLSPGCRRNVKKARELSAYKAGAPESWRDN